LNSVIDFLRKVGDAKRASGKYTGKHLGSEAPQNRLQHFKTACDEDLPEMTSPDLAEARLYFELKCKRAAEMRRDEEAEKKHTASEGGSVH
jgi:hypothetical protein